MGRCTNEWVAASRRPIRRFPTTVALICVVTLASITAACTGTETGPSTVGSETGVDAESPSESDVGSTQQTATDAAETPASPPTTIDPQVAKLDAQARAMVITTSRCGDAGQAVGSGIALSNTLVLTVAHVVAGATDVHVVPMSEREREGNEDSEIGDGSPIDESQQANATLIAFDPLRDLALLEVDLSPWPIPEPPAFEVLAAEQRGTIVQGATSGDIDFTVTEKTIIEMDEVRGTRRSRRSGYLLEAVTDRGDSGAGLYGTSGNLAGVLFAVSTGDSSRSWANAADELQDFLADETVTGTFACNPDRSKVERTP